MKNRTVSCHLWIQKTFLMTQATTLRDIKQGISLNEGVSVLRYLTSYVRYLYFNTHTHTVITPGDAIIFTKPHTPAFERFIQAGDR